MVYLSVIIPTYNRRESLLRTLSALAQQTYPVDLFEVIVVSDGSTDGTAQAVEALQIPYSLRFVEQPNQGPSTARNRGACLAVGTILVYVDDDIEPVSEFLAVHAEAHTAEPDLVLIGPQCGPRQERMPPWIAWEHRMLQKQYVQFSSGVWPVGPNNLYSGNFSVAREALLAVEGFDTRFTRQEDVELGFRLERYGLHFRFAERAVGLHRPTRPFASWYKTPFEYGRRDVQMACELGHPQALELAQDNYRLRKPLVKLLMHACIGVPGVESVVLGTVRLLARWGPGIVALAACSLLFNLRYMQGMSCELGGRRRLWRLIKQGVGCRVSGVGNSPNCSFVPSQTTELNTEGKSHQTNCFPRHPTP